METENYSEDEIRRAEEIAAEYCANEDDDGGYSFDEMVIRILQGERD